MAIMIKSKSQQDKMRAAGNLVARTHEYLEEHIKPGISTLEIDTLAKEFIESHDAYPTFHDYNGFPGFICISINEEVIHGIATADRILQEGDIVSLDVGATLDGFIGDAARTLAVGEISEEHQKLIDTTRESFFKGIEFAKEGHRLFEISQAIYDHNKEAGYGVVRDFVGHGVGSKLHEDPQIPNFPQKRGGPRLREGMTLAIEPMVNQGTSQVKVLSDGWTAVTTDGKYSAHYENSILITDGEPEILTML